MASLPSRLSPKISPCLWFDGDAEAAAAFYVSLFADSRIVHVQRNVMDGPSGAEGSVLLVVFELAGQRFLALNGGTPMEYTYALSLEVECDDQAEVDRLWDAFTKVGRADQCGWVRDRWGVAWQVVPRRAIELITDADAGRARRAMAAVMGMVKLDIAAIEAAADGA